jgi:hypothetical protein
MVMELSSNANPLISTSNTFPDGIGTDVVDTSSVGAGVTGDSSLGVDVGSMLSIASVITGAEVAAPLEVLFGAHAAKRMAREIIAINDLLFIFSLFE